MTTQPLPVICDRCRAEGLAGEDGTAADSPDRPLPLSPPREPDEEPGPPPEADGR